MKTYNILFKLIRFTEIYVIKNITIDNLVVEF